MKFLFKKISILLLVFVKYCFFQFYCFSRQINNHEVWLISERGDDARDNSYYLFSYIKKNHPDVTIKYVIKKSSADYYKVRALGDVIEYGSSAHFKYFITAGVLISTHIMGYSPDMSLFWRLDRWGLLKVNGKKVFLQHGVTHNYIPMLTNKYSKLDLFLCGAMPEYKYIKNHFGHPDGVVKYTGFPRYDTLKSKPQKQILLIPTFRKWLNYVDDFQATEYFKRYNALFNNSELNKMLEDTDYKLIFYPHYEIQKRIAYFSSMPKNKNLVLATYANSDIQKLLNESDMLITDYSSVFFDFAYMRKPVVYYQFDADRFRTGHYKKGYFSYTNDGFGPVIYDEVSLVKEIRSIINNRTSINQMYLKRVNDFYDKSDHRNSQRSYKAIVNMLNRFEDKRV